MAPWRNEYAYSLPNKDKVGKPSAYMIFRRSRRSCNSIPISGAHTLYVFASVSPPRGPDSSSRVSILCSSSPSVGSPSSSTNQDLEVEILRQVSNKTPARSYPLDVLSCNHEKRQNHDISSNNRDRWAVFTEVDMDSSDSSSMVRATIIQALTIFCDTSATLGLVHFHHIVSSIKLILAEAASFGSQLVVFPESFVGGYPLGSNFDVTISNHTLKGKEDFQKYHAAAINVPGPEVDRLAQMALKYKVFLVIGVIEKDGYTLYCFVLFFDNQGYYLGKNRKLMPTALERIIWGFGVWSHVPVFDTPIGKIGATICWGNKMPLLRTTMYAKGIEIYCAPTADSRDVWQASMTHIALEGGCFVLSANSFWKYYPASPEYVFSGIDELTPESIVYACGSVAKWVGLKMQTDCRLSEVYKDGASTSTTT
ncbi:LOW QUALITY PROTEIN: hypothetical protein M8C21_003980 [Ambrosia artemisiifolia]|uniref:CN hydrolase domain-containing protein n=1 Tax=Ambrosia artemisiifolia TaxID=4212 RepID=A0AAD5GCA5_AMBAR|nr:LOW QUALITY PROTEIN: hypothetical protein M8C21_003980 [Ambrosia artemisiifolia]